MTEKDVDDALQAIYDIADADDIATQMLIEYCHQHKKEIADSLRKKVDLGQEAM